MSIKQLLARSSFIRRVLKRPNEAEIMDRFQLDPSEKDRIATQASGALAHLFFEHRGRVIHKWVHYLEIYEAHFAQYRDTPVRLLEIGVFKGGSLELWREYLGANATIFGIDINRYCAGYVTEPNQVRIGSQDNADFLKKVVLEMGAPDIVLDDGSHVAEHQRKSFDVLFPLLKPGGLYIMEDLHTAYWPGSFHGGYGRKNTAIGHVKQMIDDMHAWYHLERETTPAKTEIRAIHIYDSIVVIEKQHKEQPAHIKVGSSNL